MTFTFLMSTRFDLSDLAERPATLPMATVYGRRSPRNRSRNLPEVTNLNHQYASRRVLICRIQVDPGGPTED